MKAVWAVGIMTAVALVGYFAGRNFTNSEEFGVSCAILLALISGIGCIIEAINKKPADKEE